MLEEVPKPEIKKVVSTNSCVLTISEDAPKPKIPEPQKTVSTIQQNRDLSPPSFPEPSSIPNYNRV